MQFKKCNHCGLTKALDFFTKSKPSANYKTQNQTHHSYCKECNASRAREWRKLHPNYRGSGTINNTPLVDRLLMSAIRQRLTDAKSRTKKYSKSVVTVTAEYLYELFNKQDRKCALTRAELLIEQDHPLCLSLDQIDPTKGYTEGNVQWLAWAVNRAKGNLSTDDFYDMCEVILNNRKAQRLS